MHPYEDEELADSAVYPTSERFRGTPLVPAERAESSRMTVFDGMVGKTMASVSGGRGSEAMDFTTVNGDIHRFFYIQDGTADVCVEDIDGELSDLVGSPLLVAEEVSSEDAQEPEMESYTWTFYKFATVKGSVTVRWLGTSTGYYSESVSYACVPAARVSECLGCPRKQECEELERDDACSYFDEDMRALWRGKRGDGEEI